MHVEYSWDVSAMNNHERVLEYPLPMFAVNIHYNLSYVFFSRLLGPAAECNSMVKRHCWDSSQWLETSAELQYFDSCLSLDMSLTYVASDKSCPAKAEFH